MSKIDNLIKQLCPKGVEKKKLKSLGSFYGGLSGKSKEDFEKGNAVFISYKNIYSNPSLDIHPSDRVYIQEGEKQTVIQYGDILFTGSSETPDECGFSSVVTDEPEVSMYLNSFCFGYRLNSLQAFNLHFLKLLFRSSELRKAISKTASGVTRYNVSKKLFGEIEIPLPPLHIQEEIVRILDKMVEQQQTIEKLIELRKKQYEYYREELLKPKEGWVTKTLGEIGTNLDSKRKPITGSKREKGDFPYYGASGIVDYVKNYIFDGTYLLISEDGANLLARSTPIAFIITGKNWVNNHAHVIEIKDYNERKFVEIFLNSISLEYYISDGAQPKLNQENLNKIEVSFPSKQDLEKIVPILDKLESSISELTQTLEVCKKRYTHYRDELLRF